MHCLIPLSLSEVYARATWSAELCFGLVFSSERSGQLFIMLSRIIRQINKEREQRPCRERNEKRRECKRELLPMQGRIMNLSVHACASLCCPSAPEVVARHRYGRPVDCWAVGVIMFIL